MGIILLLASCAVPPAPAPLAAPAQSGEIGPGTVYYLSPEGSDDGTGAIDDPWRSMFHASDVLRPGDTLLARGGRYTGQGGDGWAASGEPGAQIVFAGYPGEIATFDGDGTGSFLILDQISNVTIRDMTITGYEPLDTGVLVINGPSEGITLERLTMTGNHRDAPAGRWTEHLIYPGPGPVRDLTVRDCTLDADGLSGGAIHVFHDPGPENLRVEGNTITNAHWGVLIDADARGVVVTGNILINNDLNVSVLDDRAVDVRVDPDQLGDT